MLKERVGKSIKNVMIILLQILHIYMLFILLPRSRCVKPGKGLILWWGWEKGRKQS